MRSLRSKNVSTEVNTVFQSLVDVLHQIDPPKLNAVLTAFAEAVRGRGERIGEATTAANHVLVAVNPRMGTVAARLALVHGCQRCLQRCGAGHSGDLRCREHDQRDDHRTLRDLDALLLNTIGFAQAGIDLHRPQPRTIWSRAINVLEPTTDLLMKYNPEYTCLLVGAKWSLDNGAYDAAGGNGRTIVIDDGLLFGDDPYRYPDNLPIVAAKGGPGGKPGCGSLPDVSKNFPVRQLVTNTGWGTGLDIRPNPGIGHPWCVDFFPVTRGMPAAAQYPRSRDRRRSDRCPTRARRRTARRCTARTGHRCTRRRPGAPPARDRRPGRCHRHHPDHSYQGLQS